MPDDLMSPEQFAASAKKKYPQYAGIPDAELVKKITAKYPQYRSKIRQDPLPNARLAPASGAPSSMSMKTGEGPIATNLTSFESQLSQLPKASVQLLLAKHWPIVDAKNYSELWNDIKSLNPVMRQYEGGPVDPGATAANLLPMLVDAKGMVGKAGDVIKDVARVPAEGTRKALTTLAGAGPERTTEPLVEEFKTKSAEAKKAQGAENEKTVAANRQGEQTYHDKLSKTFDEAKQDQIEQHRARTDVEERNQAAQVEQGHRAELATQINQGSKQFGEGVKELARNVKAKQIDPQYARIREATASDPGEPLAAIAGEAREAERLITGSSENIKQFRELLHKAPETEGVQTSAGFTVPGDPLYEQLVTEGAIDTGGNLSYSDIHGYASELGAKLRQGGLPSDIYRAIKHLKDKLDSRQQTIAERNGVGSLQTKADSDYTHYQDTFFDKPSAIADTLARVGKLDPEHYAAPVISGKAAQLGILRLQHYAKDFPEANRLATQAKSLRQKAAEFKVLPKKAKLTDVPQQLIPVPKSLPELEVKTPKQIEQPKTPILEDVRERKTKEVKSEAREIGRLNRYDATLLAGSAIGPFFGRWETLLIDPAYLVARKSLGKMLNRPAVLKWLAEPSLEDIRILNTLPPEAKAEIAGKMASFIAQERKPVPLNPATKRFLGPVALSAIDTAAMNKRQTPDTARDVMRDLKGKPPGQQKKDLADIQRKYSNPMMPVGPE